MYKVEKNCDLKRLKYVTLCSLYNPCWTKRRKLTGASVVKTGAKRVYPIRLSLPILQGTLANESLNLIGCCGQHFPLSPSLSNTAPHCHLDIFILNTSGPFVNSEPPNPKTLQEQSREHTMGMLLRMKEN